MKTTLSFVVLACCLLLAPSAATAATPYEVWAIDQSSSFGKTYGGTLYIHDGKSLETLVRGPQRAPEVIDLAGDAATLCFALTGANPVRPHMIAMNASQSHAIISFVASGHVLIMNAATRQPVDCIRTSVGSTGARQVHFAIPSPDETYIAVANQNGKLFERINTDYETGEFVLDAAATIDLATCATPNGHPCQDMHLRPDNAPICPIIDASSRLVWVTLRGGGLFVVDGTTTPMTILAEYDIDTVHPNGCLGVQLGDKMYVDSGGGTGAHLFGADIYAFPIDGYSAANPPNTLAPTVVLSDTSDEADAHGASLTGHGKFLWVADRGRNFIWVIETATDKLVAKLPLEGAVSDDPTPDLLATSPNGAHVFVSLRGPEPLTADPHVSTGSTPGIGVIKVRRGGRSGRLVAVAPVTNVDAMGIERADVHALTLRLR